MAAKINIWSWLGRKAAVAPGTWLAQRLCLREDFAFAALIVCNRTLNLIKFFRRTHLATTKCGNFGAVQRTDSLGLCVGWVADQDDPPSPTDAEAGQSKFQPDFTLECWVDEFLFDGTGAPDSVLTFSEDEGTLDGKGASDSSSRDEGARVEQDRPPPAKSPAPAKPLTPWRVGIMSLMARFVGRPKKDTVGKTKTAENKRFAKKSAWT